METATNITIHQMTERIEYNFFFEINGDERENHLHINIKYTLIV